MAKLETIVDHRFGTVVDHNRFGDLLIVDNRKSGGGPYILRDLRRVRFDCYHPDKRDVQYYYQRDSRYQFPHDRPPLRKPLMLNRQQRLLRVYPSSLDPRRFNLVVETVFLRWVARKGRSDGAIRYAP